MDNKYYTPDVSELFVGYECSKQTSWGWISGKWPDVLGMDTHYNIFHKKGNSPHETVLEWSKDLRTAYLTKEQIEAEGWTIINSPFGTLWKGSKMVTYNKEVRGWHFDYTVPVELEIGYDFKTKLLSISYDCGEFMNCRHYEGLCPSINEFRKICKLLGI